MAKKYEFVEPTLKLVELDAREIICMSGIDLGDLSDSNSDEEILD